MGSHVVRECRRLGWEAVVFDNFSTGHPRAVRGVECVTGDLLDPRSIRSAFENFRFDGVIHTGTKGSGEASLSQPAESYRNNVAGTLQLVHAMLEADVSSLVFSSSAVVYGAPVEIPIPETHETHPLTPFAHGMLMVERCLADISSSQDLRYASLRYFSAAGADRSGDIGENPNPANGRDGESWISQLVGAALGESGPVSVGRAEYDTPDGSPVRDFLHVSDVALAHLHAFAALEEQPNQVLNVSGSEGYSLSEIVQEFETIIGQPVPTVEGDVDPSKGAALVASNDKIRALTDWRPYSSDLHTILESAWNWRRENPQGYPEMTSAGEGAQLFGDLAIRLGFITSQDVEKALERQRREREAGNQHKLIGVHMLEMGLLSTSQLIEILRHYEGRSAE